jgi:hypothetical protein
MLNLFLIYFLIFIKPCPNEYIIISHIGPEDSPIETLIITKKPIQCQFDSNEIEYWKILKNIVVDDKEYQSLVGYFNNVQRINFQSDSFAYGTFRISIKSDTSYLKYEMDGKTSLQIFKKLIIFLKNDFSNTEITEAIVTIIKKID